MISILNLSMRFGAKILFKDVHLQFNPGNRYGLVGANGCGKSTFIKILSKDVSPEAGEISLPTQLTMGSLKQNHYLYEEEEILNVVMQGRDRLWKALEEQRALLQHESFSEVECHSLDKIGKILEEEEGYMAASEAAKLLEGLGINEEWHKRPLKLLSGGYKLRVLLAQLLFGKPDILVLDEPTNHLDLFSIKWLEGYLCRFPGTLVVSSHDRDFINGVCSHIVDIDYRIIKIYKGNYDGFLKQKQQDREQKEAQLLKQDKRRADIQEFIDRFRAKASKARQAQSKARFVEKLEQEIEAIDLTPSGRLYPQLSFVPFRSSGATVLVTKELSKAYGPKQVLKNVSFEIERGEKIAIIGPNGIGKSTLLEILTNHSAPDLGTFNWGFAIRVAYFPQDHAREVQGKMSLLDWLGCVDPEMRQEQLREVLARVLFIGDTVNQSVETLSGGETARLILAKMMIQKPNVLIFDEPTNHLDMEAIEELTNALLNYSETILFVSHNRYFVSKVANRILEINYQTIKDFKGSYSEYVALQEQDLLVATSLRQRDLNRIDNSASTTYEDQKKLRNLKSQLRRKVTQLEEESTKLEEKIKEIEHILSSEGFYQRATQKQQQDLIKQKTQVEEKLMGILDQWEKTSFELQQTGKE